MKRIVLIVFTLSFSFHVQAQSFLFGPKFGPSIGLQQWDNFEKDPLFAFHGSVYIESYSEDDIDNSLYAQLGYHVRGSANRYNGSNGNFSLIVFISLDKLCAKLSKIYDNRFHISFNIS